MVVPKADILAYADGSCEGNPGPGGWGVVIVGPFEPREISGSDPQTTNNRMEITAAIEALRALEPGERVIVRSDSQYVVNTMNLGWRRTKNLDLWKQLDAEAAKREVRFEWVQGHAGDPLNETADRLAREASRKAARGPLSPSGEASSRRPARAGNKAAYPSSGSAPGAGQQLLSELTPLLRRGEHVGKCACCGNAFVALSDECYCSLAACQLVRRKMRAPREN